MNTHQYTSMLILTLSLGIPACGKQDTDQGSGTAGDDSAETSTSGDAEDTSAGETTGEAAGTDADASAEAEASTSEATGADESGADSQGDGDGDGATTDPTTTSGGTDSGSFISGDVGSSCGTQCDIWNPNECAEGEKCTAVICEAGSNSWDSNRCREIQGGQTVGDECERTGEAGDDTCETGTMCWDVDTDTGIGTCVAFCTGSPEAPECASGSTCGVFNDGVLPLCLPGCDPLAQDCEGGNLCIPIEGGFACVLDASGGMAPYGTPCMYANACNAGLVCLNAAAVPEPACSSSVGCCSPFCDINEANTCPGDGQLCESLYDPGMEPPGFEHVGVCAVPQG